jgi:MSHA biogenesis protein MshO
MRAPHNQQAGFTLVEMIMVIVITGIIGGMVAVFLKAPIQQYMDVARRAELTDIADTAIRRMARDVRTAVPNSVRIANCGANPCVEYLPTKDGGRYRADTGGNNNILTFGTGGTTQFDIVGTGIPIVANTDYIVVGSTQSDGVPPYDVTAGILRKVTAMANGNTTITFAAPVLPIWAELSTQRFDVVDGTQKAVTYACVGGGVVNGDGVGKLMRYSNYGFNVAPTSVTPAILASKVDCTKTSIDYDVPNQRFGLLAIRLTLTSGGESVSLYNEIHVNNTP